MKIMLKSLVFIGIIALLVFSLSDLILAQGLDAPKFNPEIEKIISAGAYSHANWGLLVLDLESTKTVYELNAGKMFCPGSTVKLFTVAAALDTFGIDYRFKTPVYRCGEITSSGELKGDLILVANGDITMGGRAMPDGHIAYTEFDHTDANALDGAVLTDPDPLAGLDKLARQVAQKGIKKISGDIVIDDRLFDMTSPGIPGCDFKMTPIMINDNLIDFVITSSEPGKTAKVKWRPNTLAYKVDAKVNTIAEGKENAIKIKLTAPGHITLRGEILAGSKPLVKTYTVQDPSSFARSLFIEALNRAGVETSASVLAKNSQALLPSKDAYANLPQVALFASEPFPEYARLILKVSHNQGADTLPLLIAARNNKRTFWEGLRLEHPFFQRAGVDRETFSISDGGGGVKSDLLSPVAVVQLLSYMAEQADFKAYYDALPIMGVDGTLATVVGPESPVRGKVSAKTGTIVDYDIVNDRYLLLSKGLAGYMNTSKGKKFAFALYVNNIHMDNVEDLTGIGKTFGKICEIIYENN